MKLHDIFKTSIINTIRFNLYYFGLRRIFRPPVLISKNVSLHALKGNVVVNNSQIGAIRLGYGSVGIIDGKKERFIWENAGNVIFDNRAVLNIGTRVCCMKGGTIKFGRNFVCNGRSSFICAKVLALEMIALFLGIAYLWILTFIKYWTWTQASSLTQSAAFV